MVQRSHADITRRTVLGAGALGLMAATTRAIPADAAFVVPEVDSLRLQVVTDAATFGPFLDNLDLPGMKVLRVGNGGGPSQPRMSPHPLLAEFGLSILGTSIRAGQTRRVMVDFG